jgi:hypothetical protein
MLDHNNMAKTTAQIIKKIQIKLLQQAKSKKNSHGNVFNYKES